MYVEVRSMWQTIRYLWPRLDTNFWKSLICSFNALKYRLKKNYFWMCVYQCYLGRRCLCMKASIVQVAAFVRLQKETSQPAWFIFQWCINLDRFEEIEVFLQRREKTHTTRMHCFGSALLGMMKPFSLFVLAVLDNTHFQQMAVGWLGIFQLLF